MSLLPMYPGKINSPALTLTTGIDSDDTTIVVTGDISKLPAAPNTFVLGTGEDAETVYYPTDAVTNTFAGVTRGFQGTAKSWDAGTYIARLYTAYDYDALRQNLLKRGFSQYAAIVLQDSTTTYAVDKDGNILSSVLKSENTDDIPIQAAIDYAANGATTIYMQVLGNVFIAGGLYHTTTKIDVKYSVGVECEGLGTIFHVGNNDFAEMYGCSSWSGGYVLCGMDLATWTNTAFLFQADKNHSFLYVKSGYIRDVFLTNGATDTTGGKGIWLDASSGTSGETFIYGREFSNITVENFSIGIYLSTNTNTEATNGVTWCYFNNITLNYTINMIKEEHLGTSGTFSNNYFHEIKMQAASTPEPSTNVGLYISGDHQTFNNVSIMDWNLTYSSYGVHFSATAVENKVIVSIYNEGDSLESYVHDDGISNTVQIAFLPTGIPTYDVVVYQDNTYTRAITSNGMLISTAWRGTYTDDVVIQAAINYLETLSDNPTVGFNLYINSGIYYMNTTVTITKPHKIIGAGKSATILRSAAATPMFQINPPDTVFDANEGWEECSLVMRDLSLTGASWTGTYGIMFGTDINYVHGAVIMCQFENCNFSYFANYGVYDNSNWGNAFYHCSFVRNGGEMQTSAAAITAAVLNKGGLASFGNSTNVRDCMFQANTVGIVVKAGLHPAFENCVIESSRYHGVHILGIVTTYPYTVGVVTDTTHFACAALHGIAKVGDFVYVNGRSGGTVTNFNDTTHVLTVDTEITGITAGDTFLFIPYLRYDPSLNIPENVTFNKIYFEDDGAYNYYYPGDPYTCYDIYNPASAKLLVRESSHNSNNGGITDCINSAGELAFIDHVNDIHNKGVVATGEGSEVLHHIVSGDVVTKGFTKSGATASRTDGSTVTHGLFATPSWVTVTGSVANQIIAVTAMDNTTFTIAIKKRSDGSAGTSQTVYWQCGV